MNQNQAKIIVIKVGSSGVSDEFSGPLVSRIEVLIKDIFSLRAQGQQVVLVTSGAINSAKRLLPSALKMDQLILQQARASVGQLKLMDAYGKASQKLSITIAQILVTHEDFKDRARFINVRNTIKYLLANGILPIINENDTVATEEITVGDNDQLAAMTAESIDAQTLLLLTESEGLFDRDPKLKGAKFFSNITFGQSLDFISFGKKTAAGRGGMETKLESIKHLTELGVDVILATHHGEHPIIDALERKKGSFFHANPEFKLSSRKLWIATVVRPKVYLVIDDGAYKALQNNSSLLPVGILKVCGKFKRGDVISIRYKNAIVAYGMSEFHSVDLEKIKGLKSKEFFGKISHIFHDVAVHRDNLYLKVKSREKSV